MRTVRSPFDQTAAMADAIIYRHGPDHPSPVADGPQWRVGVLAPAAYAGAHPGVRAHARAECLLEAGPDSVVRIRVRYLQLTTRSLSRRGPDGRFPAIGRTGDRGFEPAPGFERAPGADGDPRVLDEFVPREVDGTVTIADLLAAPLQRPVPSATRAHSWLPHLSAPRPEPWAWDRLAPAHGGPAPGVPTSGAPIPGASAQGAPARGDGVRAVAATPHIVRLSAPAGRRVEATDGQGGPSSTHIVWDSWAVQGELRVSAGLQTGTHRLVRLRAELVNISGWRPETATGVDVGSPQARRRRDCSHALRHSLVGVHLLLAAAPGRFVSLANPPTWASAQAKDCVNDGLWPTLVGTPDGNEIVLVAPLVLPDHPETATPVGHRG